MGFDLILRMSETVSNVCPRINFIKGPEMRDKIHEEDIEDGVSEIQTLHKTLQGCFCSISWSETSNQKFFFWETIAIWAEDVEKDIITHNSGKKI